MANHVLVGQPPSLQVEGTSTSVETSGKSVETPEMLPQGAKAPVVEPAPELEPTVEAARAPEENAVAENEEELPDNANPVEAPVETNDMENLPIQEQPPTAAEEEATRPKTIHRSERTIPLPIPVPPATPPIPLEEERPPPVPAKTTKKPAKAPSPRARMSTRYQTIRQKQKEARARNSFAQVRSTIGSITRQSPTRSAEPEESLPDVFSSFSSADLIRNDIGEMKDYDEDDSEATGDDSIQVVNVTGGEASTSQASTSSQANQSSILQPFSYFFWRNRENPEATTPSQPTGEAASPLDAPQTSSTPKD